MIDTTLCHINGCFKPYQAVGLCNMHYLRKFRYGRLEKLPRKIPNEVDKKKYFRKYRILTGYKSIIAMHKKRFGGLREVVLERDGYKCLICGMSNQEHLKKWKKNLTINHINKQGRYSPKPDNRLENLETLCLRCHSSKDAIKDGLYAEYADSINKKLFFNREGRDTK